MSSKNNTLFMRPYNFPHPETKENYLAELLTMLKTYPLRKENSNQDGEFYAFHNAWVKYDARNERGETVYYVQNLPDGVFMCRGNFFNYSYAFCVYTDDPELIKTLKEAIDANVERPDYQEQIKTIYPPYYSELATPEIITDWAQSLSECGQGKTYVAF